MAVKIHNNDADREGLVGLDNGSERPASERPASDDASNHRALQYRCTSGLEVQKPRQIRTLAVRVEQEG